MAKKTIEVDVTYKYTLEVDDENFMVKEYESENELIIDCANYRFLDILPVISDGGVKVKHVDVIEII